LIDVASVDLLPGSLNRLELKKRDHEAIALQGGADCLRAEAYCL